MNNKSPINWQERLQEIVDTLTTYQTYLKALGLKVNASLMEECAKRVYAEVRFHEKLKHSEPNIGEGSL